MEKRLALLRKTNRGRRRPAVFQSPSTPQPPRQVHEKESVRGIEKKSAGGDNDGDEPGTEGNDECNSVRPPPMPSICATAQQRVRVGMLLAAITVMCVVVLASRQDIFFGATFPTLPLLRGGAAVVSTKGGASVVEPPKEEIRSASIQIRLASAGAALVGDGSSTAATQSSYAELLRDPSTPQGKAFHWVASEDSREVHPDDETLVQRYALAVLYYSAGGSGWTPRGDLHFLSVVHECHWNKRFGLTFRLLGVRSCDRSMQVTELVLAENRLVGSIPPEIGLLTNLRHLDLHGNELIGELPDSLRHLAQLNYLDLSSNKITGYDDRTMNGML